MLHVTDPRTDPKDPSGRLDIVVNWLAGKRVDYILISLKVIFCHHPLVRYKNTFHRAICEAQEVTIVVRPIMITGNGVEEGRICEYPL